MTNGNFETGSLWERAGAGEGFQEIRVTSTPRATPRDFDRELQRQETGPFVRVGGMLQDGRFTGSSRDCMRHRYPPVCGTSLAPAGRGFLTRA